MKKYFLDGLQKIVEEFIEAHYKQMQENLLAEISKLLPRNLTAIPEYLTISETALYLKISKPTLHSLRVSGKLTPFFINSGLRYLKSDIEAFLLNGKVKAN